MGILFPRVDCPSNQQFYTCASNGFTGCCSVDACALPGCPDSGTPSQRPTSKPSKSDPKGQDSTASQASSTTQSSTLTVSSQPAQQPSSSQIQASSQQAATSTSNVATSIQAPVTVFVTSQVIQTPTSNGVALAPTTILVTSASVSLPAAVSQSPSSTAAAIPTTTSSSSSSTPIIAGVVAGVVGAVIGAVLLWFCWRRRSKKRKELREETAAHNHEDDPREQGIDANRAGDVIAGYGAPYRGADRLSKVKVRDSMAGSESTAAGTEYGDPYEKKLPISPVTPIHQGYVDDAVPYLDSTPVRPNAEMAGSSPDPTGFTPELSGVAAPHQPAELSPNPERLGINRSPAYEYGVNGNTDSRTPDRSVMRSNLNLSNRGHNRRAHNGRGRHVMSWMEYDGSDRTARPHATDVSPTSGVWSGTNSSTARNSGVSQDSPTLGWQQERRIRGRGEAEAIREEGAH